jgi:hypothetical protein
VAGQHGLERGGIGEFRAVAQQHFVVIEFGEVCVGDPFGIGQQWLGQSARQVSAVWRWRAMPPVTTL